jgi:hypothetical protein
MEEIGPVRNLRIGNRSSSRQNSSQKSARVEAGRYKVRGMSCELERLSPLKYIGLNSQLQETQNAYRLLVVPLHLCSRGKYLPPPAQGHPSRTIQKRSARTSNPGGCLEVQVNNPSSTQYSTLSSAVAALGSGTTSKCIFMWPGTYNERVNIQYGGALNIYGYSVK